MMDTLFWIGLLLILGYAAGRMSERFRLPKVSGYILIGIMISPSVTHLLPETFLEEASSLVHLALAIIAFMIGGSLKLETVGKLERSIFSVMLSASEMTFAVVAAGLYFLLPYLLSADLFRDGEYGYLEAALFLGAIGAATAPAAVLAVVHQYRARGPLTSTLLGVVATDDAVALINFTLVVGLVAALHGNGEGHFLEVWRDPLASIGMSILLGMAAGWLQGRHIIGLSKENNLMVSTFGVLLALYALVEYYQWDGLLACMAYGMVLVNTAKQADEIFRIIQHHFEEIVFVLFFIISGATIEQAVISDVFPLALLYVVLRICGKMAGSWIGAKAVGAPENVRKYIGLAQMPQAGVAIGLALTLYHDPAFAEGVGAVVLNSVIAATVVNELLGPVVLKYVLIKSGEAKEEGQ
jgi:NhaP-type Na+/H+ or K+/H+ antiporter